MERHSKHTLLMQRTNNFFDNHRITSLDYDAELYHKVLGRINKEINSTLEEEKKAECEKKKSAVDDISDINKRFDKKNMSADEKFNVLLDEFEPVGEEVEHLIGSGLNKGTSTVKQTWSK